MAVAEGSGSARTGIAARLEPLAEDARTWRVSHRLAVALLVLPVLGAVVVAGSRASLPLFRFLTREDSVIEWAQVLGWVATAAFAAPLALRLFRTDRRWQGALFGGVTLASIFVAGEEISWGQRIFDIETPEALEEVNKQGETTVHNVGDVLAVFNATMFLISVAGVLLPFLAKRIPALRRDPWRFFVPPMFLTGAFAVMAAYKLVRFTVARESHYTTVKFGEWPELTLVLALAVYVALLLRRERQTD